MHGTESETERQLLDWRKRADNELGQAPFESLLTQLPEGFLLEPLYVAAPVAGHVAAARTELGKAAEDATRLDLSAWDGAHMVDQLGIALAMVVDALRAGQSGAVVQLPLGPDVLREIAKLRALRRLVARVGELAGEAAALTICAHTAHRQAAPDLGTNLIRNTAAAFSALVGGADYFAPLAHGDDVNAARLADNVVRLAQHEAHLAMVSDPAAGSYALESLTEALCAGAWAVFQEIEKHGGFGDPRGRVIAEARYTSGGAR